MISLMFPINTFNQNQYSMDECQGVLERVHKSLADLEVQVQKIERGEFGKREGGKREG